MTTRRFLVRAVLACAFGIVAATAFASSALADACECNVCITASGNCDFWPDWAISCKETTWGCDNRSCEGQCMF